jgi:hypothetical protein
MSWALLAVLWAVLVLPSANFGHFDGLPLDTVPELIGLLLLIPLTVSGGLRRYMRCLMGAHGRVVPAALVVIGLTAVGGKLALLASGTFEGFLGCYSSPLAPPPTEPCERSFANPWYRYSATRVDTAIDFGPETWNLSFLNSRRFSFYGRKAPGRPLRDRLPLEVTWQGIIERASPWVVRVVYIGEVGLRVSPEPPNHEASEVQLVSHYGTAGVVEVPVPAGRHLFELTYRFDDGARWLTPVPVGPWATLRLERGGRADGTDLLVTAASPATVWRALAAVVDLGALALGVAVLLGYAVLLRRDWWAVALVGVTGLVVSRFHAEDAGLPTAFGVFLALLGLALLLLARPWRRRLVLALFSVAFLNLCLVLSSTARLDMVLYRAMPSDPLSYESQARTILETWSLEGGEPVFRYQPGFRYWRFLERFVLGDGDPFVVIFGLTLLAWGYLFGIARLWPRPRPTWPRAFPYALGAGLLLGLATSTPVVAFVEAPLSEYPTWMLLPVAFTLLFGTRRPRQWIWGGVLGGVALLCRLNHILAILGYMAVFVHQRWRGSPRAVAMTVGLLLAMMTLPALHNRYYGGPETEARRILSVNRAAVAITPSRLAELHRDPSVRQDLWDQVRRILYLHEAREATPEPDRWSRLTMWGLQWLWLGTAIVALPRRRLAAGTRALLLVPLLYFVVYLVYTVGIYYPRHILAGHFALGVTVLYTLGPGWVDTRPERKS